jgi:hypothetical protein
VVGRFLPRDFFWDVGGFFAGIDGSVLCVCNLKSQPEIED